MKHGKIICDANRPKDLEEYDFEVSERLRETLVTSGIAPDAVLAMAHVTDWKTVFFSKLEPEKIFSSPGTLQFICCQER